MAVKSIEMSNKLRKLKWFNFSFKNFDHKSINTNSGNGSDYSGFCVLTSTHFEML